MEYLDIGFFVSGTINGSTYDYMSDPGVVATHRIFIVVVVTYMPLIIGCNIIVFWGILLYPGFYTNNNLLLLSLAFADFLVGIYCLPMYLLSYIEVTRVVVYSSEISCVSWLTSGVLSAGGSLVSLLFIAIDRYVAVIWPLKYGGIITAERLITSLLLFWVLIFIIAFLPNLGLNNYNPHIQNLVLRCNLYITLPKYYVYGTVLGGAAPIVLISGALYSQIIYIVWKQAKRLHSRQSLIPPEQASRLEHRIKSVQRSSFLMLAFVVMWFPYVSITPFKYFNVFSQASIEIVKCFALMFTFGNSLLNPFVYALLRENYRTVYKLMIITPPWKWKKALRVLYIETNKLKSKYTVGEIATDQLGIFKPTKTYSAYSDHNNVKAKDVASRFTMSRKVSQFSKVSAIESTYFSLYTHPYEESDVDLSQFDIFHQLYRVVPSLTSIVQSQLKQSSSQKVTGIDSAGNKTLNPSNTQSRDTEIYRDCLPYDHASVIP
ncbi:histamine H2 receptor-like [Biomphalaria glabrata]|uniref:Histamine H2 receptor-like n=1 Tax=Biomphalaria glabrata TaxID=6526 RepID=A0A9W3BF13_BIOGL|nr:histamine H2 receptor-like [Biomphalaria glabrata]KAI8789887.1 histamine H2 receptor [Biomphalaria glabrata]